MPKDQLRSESTERAKALTRQERRLADDAYYTSRNIIPPSNAQKDQALQEDVETFKQTSSYRKGGPVKKPVKKGKR